MYDPNTAPPPKAGRPHWTAGAIAVLVIGLLILVPSGLCTGVFGFGALYEMMTASSNNSEATSILAAALVIGGLPIALGAILVFVAFQMRRRN